MPTDKSKRSEFAQAVLAEVDGVRAVDEIARTLDENGTGLAVTLASTKRTLSKLARDGVVEPVTAGVWRRCEPPKPRRKRYRHTAADRWLQYAVRAFGKDAAVRIVAATRAALASSHDAHSLAKLDSIATPIAYGGIDGALRIIAEGLPRRIVRAMAVVLASENGITANDACSSMKCSVDTFRAAVRAIESRSVINGFSRSVLVYRRSHNDVKYSPTFFHAGVHLGRFMEIVSDPTRADG